MVRASLGTAGVTLAFAGSVMGAVLFAAGLVRRDRRLKLSARGMVALVGIGAVVAVGAMQWALLTDDFSLAYLANNHARSTPLLFTIATMWSALEGSILLWGLVLAGYLVWVTWRFRGRLDDPLVGWALVAGLVVAVFFFGLMLGPANPFAVVSPVPADGPGPNPLLQNHVLMAFHPPLLDLGYVGFTVPFMFAIGALVTGRLGEGWLVATRRATLFAWGCLTMGIILGGWWSYEVLGWGGYWAWDPVENASLLPWLTATAYLHSVVIQERRGMLRVWNLSLVLATFCLTILGTFLTRSGVVNSVHAFSESPIGPALLGFLAFCAVVSIALIGWRTERLRSPGMIDSPLSREAAFLANNLLFTVFTAVVLLGTVFPLLVEAYNDEQLSVGAPYFDDMTRPIGFLLLFLMAVAPALPWRIASGDLLHRRLAAPAAAAAGAGVIAVAAGMRGVAPVLAIGLGVFAVAGIVRQVVVAVRAHRRHRGSGWTRTLIGVVARNRRLYGGLVVHLGVVLIAIALAVSSSYTLEREARLEPGETTALGGYQIRFLDTVESTVDGKQRLSARFAIRDGSRELGTYAPALTQYPNFAQAIGTPSVRTGLIEDVYLSLLRAPTDGDDAVTVAIKVNPLVVWLWIGAGVMAAGTAIAAWPTGRKDSRPSPAPNAGRDSDAPTEHAEEPDSRTPREPVAAAGSHQP
jgi:cytochrome c-type biogenesis protein CcmF